ncbi:MAG: 3-phosphoshikimate 1-carboxyvinyltransferase, partial [Herbaspirillum sp.]
MVTEFALYLDLLPAQRACGTVALPGSKSISNRTLLLAALATGTTQIRDLLKSDDTQVMLDALRELGIAWQAQGDSHDYSVVGAAGRFPQSAADVFMGNAGTAMRPLTAALAAQGGNYHLHGVPRMHERPIGDLVDALNAVGMQIVYTGVAGYPPLQIEQGEYNGQTLQVHGNVSSQFLTALLMAAPLLASRRAVTIQVIGELISKPYVEITLNLMRRFGVEVERDGWSRFQVRAGQTYQS